MKAKPKPKAKPKAKPKTEAGDAPVAAYIAGLPKTQRAIAERIDALAAAALPNVQRAIKWGMAYYGVGDGWCFSAGAFGDHVKLLFIRGTELTPEPPVTPVGMGKTTRGIDVSSLAGLDQIQTAAWMKQAATKPYVGAAARNKAKSKSGRRTGR